ncbi:1041_t:CDS:2, partial [Funneliformis mosseae]
MAVSERITAMESYILNPSHWKLICTRSLQGIDCIGSGFPFWLQAQQYSRNIVDLQ